MKFILILNRDGKEKMDHRFDAPTTKDAVTKSKALILKEHKERQAEFPFTPEPPPDAILFRECWKQMP